MNESGYPLAWPPGWPRTNGRLPARFKDGKRTLPLDVAIRRLEDELRRLNARDWIVSTNLRPRLSGVPINDHVGDPGAAVYFTRGKQRLVLACDAWNRAADNIAAIAAHIDALRAIERYGVGTLERVFRGYLALPAPRTWCEVLGFNDAAVTLSEVRVRYRMLAKSAHPDLGGSEVQMAALNVAITQAEAELNTRAKNKEVEADG